MVWDGMGWMGYSGMREVVKVVQMAHACSQQATRKVLASGSESLHLPFGGGKNTPDMHLPVAPKASGR